MAFRHIFQTRLYYVSAYAWHTMTRHFFAYPEVFLPFASECPFFPSDTGKHTTHRRKHMLDNHDLKLLKNLFAESEERLEKRFDEKLSSLDARFNEKLNSLEARFNEKLNSLDARFDEKLGSLDARFNEKFNSLETQFNEKLGSLETRFDQKLADMQVSLKQCIEDRASQTENTLLDEMDRYDRKYEQRFHKLENDVEILNSFYRISRNENQNFQILLKITDDLNRRLTIVEQQIAAA